MSGDDITIIIPGEVTVPDQTPEARGPYTNEDGDWWFPVECWGWNEAQKEAAAMARDADCVTSYCGIKVDVPLYEDDGRVARRTAYHFQDVEATR